MEIRRFSELNIRRTEIDGKRVFDATMTTQSNLCNCELVIVDFEANVKTKHGDDKYLVEAEHNGNRVKFFTGSPDIIFALDECRTNNAFPFLAKLSRNNSAKGSSYKFE